MTAWEMIPAGDDGDIVDLTTTQDGSTLTAEDKATIAQMIQDALNAGAEEISANELQALADEAKAAELAAQTPAPALEFSAGATHDAIEAQRMLEQLRAADPATYPNGAADPALIAAIAAGVAAAMRQVPR